MADGGEGIPFCVTEEKAARALPTALWRSTVTEEKAPRGSAVGRWDFALTEEKALRAAAAGCWQSTLTEENGGCTSTEENGDGGEC